MSTGIVKHEDVNSTVDWGGHSVLTSNGRRDDLPLDIAIINIKFVSHADVAIRCDNDDALFVYTINDNEDDDTETFYILGISDMDSSFCADTPTTSLAYDTEIPDLHIEPLGLDY